MSNRSYPKQGQPYTVISADNLIKISRWAYGYNRVSDLVAANPVLQTRISAGRIHSDLGGIPIVYAGDVLTIPLFDIPEAEDIEDIHPDFIDEVVIRIAGKIIYGFTTNSIERSISDIADSFSFTAPYSPDDPESVLLDAHTFHKAELFIDKKLNILGTLEGWDYKIDESQTTVTITARSKAGVLIDCQSENNKLDFSGQTFSQIANVLIKPFGIELEMPYGDTPIINEAKREPTQKIFDFLSGLAKSKGFILDSSQQGKIILDRANISGTPIMNLVQGDPIILDISAKYDGTKRFSSYKAISQTRGNASNSSETIKDETISAYRPMIFSANNNEVGDMKSAAMWEKAKSLAESTTISVTVSGWRDKNEKIILENNIVTLYAPNVSIHKETRMLIEKVNLSNDGKKATLDLVLPQAYTLDFPETMPWQR